MKDLGRNIQWEDLKKHFFNIFFKEYNIYKNKNKIIHEADETNNNSKFI